MSNLILYTKPDGYSGCIVSDNDPVDDFAECNFLLDTGTIVQFSIVACRSHVMYGD